MASPLFDINADGADRGYEATASESLSLTLRSTTDVNSVAFQVYSAAGFDADLGIAANPPRASKGAPELTLVGATSGQTVSPATVDGAVTVAMPSSGVHSWIVRCVVNNGVRTLPNGETVADPSLIHERGIFIPTGLGTRKVVCTEVAQFEVDGWAGALADLADVAGQTTYQLADGYELLVLPTDFDRGSMTTATQDAVAVTLEDGYWYSLTVEVLIKDPTATEYYIYRQQVEAYRDGAGAVIHYQPAQAPVEEAIGGNYAVTVDTSGNTVTVEIDNQSANTVNFARYIGYSRKPIPTS